MSRSRAFCKQRAQISMSSRYMPPGPSPPAENASIPREAAVPNAWATAPLWHERQMRTPTSTSPPCNALSTHGIMRDPSSKPIYSMVRTFTASSTERRCFKECGEHNFCVQTKSASSTSIKGRPICSQKWCCLDKYRVQNLCIQTECAASPSCRIVVSTISASR